MIDLNQKRIILIWYLIEFSYSKIVSKIQEYIDKQ